MIVNLNYVLQRMIDKGFKLELVVCNDGTQYLKGVSPEGAGTEIDTVLG